MEPTRLAGLAAFSFSVVVCTAGWLRRRRKDEATGMIAGVAITQALLLLDMAFNWRWVLHDFWERQSWVIEHYDQRRVVQLPVLVGVCLLLALGSGWILFKFRREMGQALMLISTWLSVGLWSCEFISYHFLDQVMYRMVGPLMVVSVMWIGLALFTGLGVLLDARRVGV